MADQITDEGLTITDEMLNALMHEEWKHRRIKSASCLCGWEPEESEPVVWSQDTRMVEWEKHRRTEIVKALYPHIVIETVKDIAAGLVDVGEHD